MERCPEERMLALEDWCRLYEENISEVICLVDLDGRVDHVSPSVERLLGFTTAEIIGRDMTEILTSSTLDLGRQALMSALLEERGRPRKRRSQPPPVELGFLHKNGSTIWAEVRFRFRCDVGGCPAGIVVVVRDIDKRKRAEIALKESEARMQQSQKMEAMGILAGGIAHDFNNILSIVLGNAEMAMEDIPRYSRTYSCLDEARKASLRARDLIKQILAFSRRAEKERRPIRICSVVKESAKLIRSSIPSTISLRQEFSALEDTVLADPTQIHQVLINLCTNAAHAMREKGGILEIRSDNQVLSQADVSRFAGLGPGKHLLLSISDTGHGIDPGFRGRIFDPYFTTKGFGEGSGLGLAVVHGIVKEHGGEIQVSSQPGKGTTFRLFFPLVDAEIGEEIPLERPIPTGDERVFFVDDEPELARLGKKMLQRLGYRVTARKDSREALRVFRSEPDRFDLVVTDMTMPGMTGVDLSREFLRVRPDIPIVLCTGYNEMITAGEAERVGIRALVVKPLAMGELAQTVRLVLDADRSKGE